MWAPADTPGPVLRKINADVNRVLQTAEVKEQYAKLGMTPGTMTMEQFAAFVRGEITKYQKIVKLAGIKPL